MKSIFFHKIFNLKFCSENIKPLELYLIQVGRCDNKKSLEKKDVLKFLKKLIVL